MKSITNIITVLGIAAMGVVSSQAKGSKDVLHFSMSQIMTNDAVEPGATGKFTATATVQGASSKQTFTASVAGLTPNTVYSLTALTNGNSAVTVLADFSTDSKGKASGSLSNPSKKSKFLPDGFDLTQLREIDVINGNSQAVLTGETSLPVQLKYMVKRNLSANGVTATLSISSSNGKTKFSLTASGLNASTNYQLVFNGTPVQTSASDSHGRLKITSAPTPDNILDLQTVDLWDASNTEVVGTATPLP